MKSQIPNPNDLCSLTGKHFPRTRTRITGTEKGFTLMEIMVALAIFGIGFIAVIELFSGSLRSAAKSQEYSKAIILCREKMNEAMIDNQLQLGNYNGDFEDGNRWEMEVLPYNIFDDEELEGFPLEILEIRIRSIWKGEKTFELVGIRAIPAESNEVQESK